MDYFPYAEVNEMWADFKEVADVESLSKEQRRSYEYSLDQFRSLQSAFEMEKREGREAGLAEGRAEGRAEEKIAIARNLKQMGLSDDVISRSSGLSPEEISKL